MAIKLIIRGIYGVQYKNDNHFASYKAYYEMKTKNKK